MKCVQLAIICVASLTGAALHAHGTYDQHVMFDNSLSRGGYYHSESFVIAPSSLEQKDDKWPLDNEHFVSPPNGLRLNWTSRTGGDWRMTLLVPTRYARKFDFQGDSVVFWCYSEDEINEANSPRVYIQDYDKIGSPAVTLVKDKEVIPAKTWRRIVLPFAKVIAESRSTDDLRCKLRELISISFMQGLDDGKKHTLYIDDVQVQPAPEAEPKELAAPTGISAKGYDRHIDITWSAAPEKDVFTYRIYRSKDGKAFAPVGTQSFDTLRFADFPDDSSDTLYYRVTALTIDGHESKPSANISAKLRKLDDDGLLDMAQEGCFRYYWDAGHSNAGLSAEITPGNANLIAVGGNGFGVMALLAATERKFITRDQAIGRMEKILRFLSTADRFHGAWPHFLDGRTGKVIPYFGRYDNGGDLVETAFMIQGLLAARQYFNRDTPAEQSIRDIITKLWREVEWDWYRKDKDSYVLYWHWSPTDGFYIDHPLIGWNETMIVYLLAIASPTHPVPASLYYSGWAGQSERHVKYRQNWSRTTEGDHFTNGHSYFGIKLDVGSGNGAELFFTQFSFMGFDPRGIHDRYTNYFTNNRNIALISHAYSLENPRHFVGYGDNCWGRSAGINSGGGRALPRDDNGTINCMASLACMPYTPRESMAALKHFYRDLGARAWGPYGFYDGFNETEDWFEANYMALNQAPITVMIENYRSGLIWRNFMANPEIAPALKAIGFAPDETAAK